MVLYINSSFLGQFFTSTVISVLYTVGSALSLLVFFYLPKLHSLAGNHKLIILFSVLEIIALAGMALATSSVTALFFFLLHFIFVPLILFCLDIFIEEIIGTQEKQTGSRRGLYLSIASLATAIAPTITGSLLEISHNNYGYIYFVSALFMLPFIMLMGWYFRKFKDPVYTPLSIQNMLHVFKSEKDIRNIVIISSHLQFFFTWMVIYTPLYLAHVAGFSWVEIGLILFVGLSAYVVLEYPIGIIADKYIGEKEMMAFGFLLIAVSTSWFAFLPNAGIAVWMFAMFLTRVGASFVEATSESYFFKKATASEAHKISLYRMTRPLSSVLGAGLGSLTLLFFDFNLLFIVLAFLMIPGLFFTLLLKDSVSLREQKSASS
jgi:MFS family permease